jgi:hypothetical protein
VARIANIASTYPEMPVTSRNQVNCTNGIPEGWQRVCLTGGAMHECEHVHLAGDEAEVYIEEALVLPALFGFESHSAGRVQVTHRGGMWRKPAHFTPITGWILKKGVVR